jgi:hypothetical protein
MTDVLEILLVILQALMPLVYLAAGIFLALCAAVSVTIFGLLITRAGIPRVA